jgi:peptidoglycan glycosyltransferase
MKILGKKITRPSSVFTPFSNHSSLRRHPKSVKTVKSGKRGTLPLSGNKQALVRLALILLQCSLSSSTFADEALRKRGKTSPHALMHTHQAIRTADSLLENRNAQRAGAIAYPDLKLDTIDVRGNLNGDLHTDAVPRFSKSIGEQFAAITPNQNVVFYSLEPRLQEFVTRTIRKAAAPHAAIVVMNPYTGAILAISGKSNSIKNIEYHSEFPAASLFKIVTAAAAIEESGISKDTRVAFRGGTYTLNKWNYLPNPRKDRRLMPVGEAMGRSCNPVFGHIALKHLDGSILARYAHRFGFNQEIGLESPLERSHANIPHSSKYQLSRTAAGFGDVTISPIHAAALVSGIANGGLLPRPYFVDRIATAEGATIVKTEPEFLQRIVQPQTAESLLEMMHYTTTVGTSRKAFMRGKKPVLGNIDVAAKTGTLRGNNPKGLNNWFVATAPIANPKVAIAVITVNAKYSSKASYLGRSVLKEFFEENRPQYVTRASLNTAKLP